MATATTSNVSFRTNGQMVAELLKRGIPFLTLEKFAQSKPLPSHSTKSLKFRRYTLSDTTTIKYLTEGVTPASNTLVPTDITLELSQIGDVVPITDVVNDTHEDNVFQECADALGENGALMVERLRWGQVLTGTSIARANGTLRTDVNTTVSLNLQRKITRALNRQYTRRITRQVASTPNFETHPVAASYVAITHTDLENDIRKMDGFVPVEKYGSISPYEGELGKVDDVRYILTPVVPIWADGGGDKGTMVSTTGVKADVYPILFLGQNAYAISAFKGQYAIKMIIRQPDNPDSNDLLGQTGSVGWKGYHGATILNDAWMCRAEVACTAL